MSLSTIERVLFLRGVALFSEIASEDLVYIARTCREEAIPRDNHFITQGDIGDCLYILVRYWRNGWTRRRRISAVG
jgi:hypothetical protein